MSDKIKMAIVDDEISILKVLEKYFTKTGRYEVSTFSNPVSAVNTINDSFDIVLMDIMMPQMNGIEALEKLMEKNPEQKVVMMTAYSTLDKVLDSHKVGASHYIMKPFESLSKVETKIEDILKK